MKITSNILFLLARQYITANAFVPKPNAINQHIKMKSTANDEAESTVTKLTGISSPEILQHDTFLLDMWGVMHDGVKPYDGVLDTVQQLKAQGKKLIILSNSSKRRDNSEKMLIKRK